MEVEQLDQLASQLKARRQQEHGQQHHGGGLPQQGLTILISGANRYDTLICCLPNAKIYCPPVSECFLIYSLLPLVWLYHHRVWSQWNRS